MSMPRAVRHINAFRVLDTLLREGPTSRAALSRSLGLTRSAVSAIVAELIGDGLVVDPGEPTERGMRTGRPSTDVYINAAHSVFLGADIGVGRYTIVALDLGTNVILHRTKPFDLARADPATVLDGLAAFLKAFIKKLPKPGAVRGVNVAIPGILDREGNAIRVPALGWANVPVVQLLRRKLAAIDTIEAENDAHAYAIAELYHAGALAPREALFVFLDAGVGGAIVHGGQLIRGHNGCAGEIGHIPVGEQGFATIGSLSGSLEDFIGRDAVLARFRFFGGHGDSLEEFLRALQEHSTAAQRTLDDWSFYLGRGLAAVTSVLDPMTIVLGGPVAALFDQARDRVIESLRRHRMPGLPVPTLQVSTLGAEGPAIGAASILHRKAFSIDENLVFHGKPANDALVASAG
jgi:predicted NBD/HSP70 family sugar kinase